MPSRGWVTVNYSCDDRPFITAFTIAEEHAQARIDYIKRVYGRDPEKTKKHREAHYDTGGAIWLGHPLVRIYLPGGLVLGCLLRDLECLQDLSHTAKDGMVRLSSRYHMILLSPEDMEAVRKPRLLRYYRRAWNDPSEQWYRTPKAKAEAATIQGPGGWEDPKGYKAKADNDG